VAVVVDASVMVEVLLRTPTGRSAALRLRGEPAAAPDILDAEVAQALRRAGRRGLLDDRQVTEALDVLLDAPVQRVPSRLLVRRTRTWWPHVTVYDALYPASPPPRGRGCSPATGRCPGRRRSRCPSRTCASPEVRRP
jgi:predicted nucleic acid-binding protein